MKQYIYGKNTILEALKGEKSIYTVYIQDSIKDNRIIELCKKKKIRIKIIDKSEFIKKLGNVRHQGVMAEVEEYRYYGLEDPHNLGAILRTCDAIGVDGVIIGKNRSVGLNGTVAKVSTGAIDHVKVAQVTNLTRTLEDLKKHSFWVVGCDLDNAQDYRQIDYNMPLVIVIGSEGFGISRLVKKTCDFNVVLPMIGHVTSLNASVATAVILYQVYNSRNPL